MAQSDHFVMEDLIGEGRHHPMECRSQGGSMLLDRLQMGDYCRGDKAWATGRRLGKPGPGLRIKRVPAQAPSHRQVCQGAP